MIIFCGLSDLSVYSPILGHFCEKFKSGENILCVGVTPSGQALNPNASVFRYKQQSCNTPLSTCGNGEFDDDSTQYSAEWDETFTNTSEEDFVVQIYVAVKFTVALDCGESLALDINDKSRIQTAEMKYLSQVVGKTRRDRIRNVTMIQEDLKCDPMLDMVKKRKLSRLINFGRAVGERDCIVEITFSGRFIVRFLVPNTLHQDPPHSGYQLNNDASQHAVLSSPAGVVYTQSETNLYSDNNTENVSSIPMVDVNTTSIISTPESCSPGATNMTATSLNTTTPIEGSTVSQSYLNNTDSVSKSNMDSNCRTNNVTAASVSSDASQSDEEMKRTHIKSSLIMQFEYYFSRENLNNDQYLLSQMDHDQYVPIWTIAQFNQIKKLTSDMALVREALRDCSNVQVDPSGEKVRPIHERSVVILREIPSDTPCDEVADLFKGKTCPKFISCVFAHNENWYVTFSSNEDAILAYRYLREEVKTFHGKPIMARIKANSFMPKNGYRPPHPIRGVISSTGQQPAGSMVPQPSDQVFESVPTPLNSQHQSNQANTQQQQSSTNHHVPSSQTLSQQPHQGQSQQPRYTGSYPNLPAAAAAQVNTMTYNANPQPFPPFYPTTNLLPAWSASNNNAYFDLTCVFQMNGLAPQAAYKPPTAAQSNQGPAGGRHHNYLMNSRNKGDRRVHNSRNIESGSRSPHHRYNVNNSHVGRGIMSPRSSHTNSATSSETGYSISSSQSYHNSHSKRERENQKFMNAQRIQRFDAETMHVGERLFICSLLQVSSSTTHTGAQPYPATAQALQHVPLVLPLSTGAVTVTTIPPPMQPELKCEEHYIPNGNRPANVVSTEVQTVAQKDLVQRSRRRKGRKDEDTSSTNSNSSGRNNPSSKNSSNVVSAPLNSTATSKDINAKLHPKFDLQESSFPPLPGTLESGASESEVFENKMADVVKGTAKPLTRDSKTTQTSANGNASPVTPRDTSLGNNDCKNDISSSPPTSPTLSSKVDKSTKTEENILEKKETSNTTSNLCNGLPNENLKESLLSPVSNKSVQTQPSASRDKTPPPPIVTATNPISSATCVHVAVAHAKEMPTSPINSSVESNKTNSQEDKPTAKLSYAQMAKKKAVVKATTNEEEDHSRKNESAPLISNNKEQKKKDITPSIVNNKAQSSTSLSRKEFPSNNRQFKEKDHQEKQIPRGWGPGHDEVRERPRYSSRRVGGGRSHDAVREIDTMDRKFKEVDSALPQKVYK
ncbi:La-related protein 4 [Nymphon striatum]|nr:La-related protein 4 [Nymphon striatum]